MPNSWDWFVKLTHWVVAILFVMNYFVLEPGLFNHRMVGYALLGVVVARLLWGLIAPNAARLSRFKPSIAQALAHFKTVIATHQDEHQGHNPAGAIMVWTLWGGLILTGLTGWATQLDLPVDFRVIKEVHELFANLTFAAVCIHVIAIIWMTKLTGRRYIQDMLPQRKQKKDIS